MRVETTSSGVDIYVTKRGLKGSFWWAVGVATLLYVAGRVVGIQILALIVGVMIAIRAVEMYFERPREERPRLFGRRPHAMGTR